MDKLQWVGFIAEHDPNEHAVPYADFAAQLVDAPAEAVARAVAFLQRGRVLFATMGCFRDLETGQSVAPKIYYTDGQWIWPSYLAYYLHQRQQLLPGNFFAHVQAAPRIPFDARAVEAVLLASFR
jgi:hypothetical protein